MTVLSLGNCLTRELLVDKYQIFINPHLDGCVVDYDLVIASFDETSCEVLDLLSRLY